MVQYGNEILLLKRSQEVGNYRGKWNVIAGFIDEEKPIEQKALEEIADETGITRSDIERVTTYAPFDYHDSATGKTWVIYAAKVELNRKPDIQLDWEHSECKWIKPNELRQYDFIVGLDETIEKMLSAGQPRS
jgi:ADP-ribose pyrophosphatase YjhB (NUDIX family)